MGLNLLAGILVFALGLIVTIGSGYLGKGLSYNEPGPGFFPRLIGIGLMICGFIESFLIFRRSEKIVAGWGDGSVRGWILWTLLGGYVFFLGRLHYLDPDCRLPGIVVLVFGCKESGCKPLHFNRAGSGCLRTL